LTPPKRGSHRSSVAPCCAFRRSYFKNKFRIAYVFYESGLSINVMYTIADPFKNDY
jgi:hypothetical protein